jgi:DNA sulfur modification protein DndC
LNNVATTPELLPRADTAQQFQRITDGIIQQYQEKDDRVWVIGFSGGKDSTTLLQLVFYALRQLPVEELHRDVHVLCNDTLVENPAVVRYIDDTLEKIRTAGEAYGFPIRVAKVTPTPRIKVIDA